MVALTGGKFELVNFDLAAQVKMATRNCTTWQNFSINNTQSKLTTT